MTRLRIDCAEFRRKPQRKQWGNLCSCLLHLLNDVLRDGAIPTNWYETHFTLLHKGGSTEDANNWRPIAILSITYKIMARLIFARLADGLDLHQSEDQYGFRKNRSCIQALLAFELYFQKESSIIFLFGLLASIKKKHSTDKTDVRYCVKLLGVLV